MFNWCAKVHKRRKIKSKTLSDQWDKPSDPFSSPWSKFFCFIPRQKHATTHGIWFFCNTDEGVMESGVSCLWVRTRPWSFTPSLPSFTPNLLLSQEFDLRKGIPTLPHNVQSQFDLTEPLPNHVPTPPPHRTSTLTTGHRGGVFWGTSESSKMFFVCVKVEKNKTTVTNSHNGSPTVRPGSFWLPLLHTQNCLLCICSCEQGSTQPHQKFVPCDRESRSLSKHRVFTAVMDVHCSHPKAKQSISFYCVSDIAVKSLAQTRLIQPGLSSLLLERRAQKKAINASIRIWPVNYLSDSVEGMILLCWPTFLHK